VSTSRALIAAALMLVAVAGCGGGGAAASATPPADADVSITAQGNAFDQQSVTAPAGKPFKLFFRNLDGQPHNVAIYRDASAADKLFVGEVVTNTAVTYDVPALEPGSWFFRCDVHPDMKGTFVAG
jgi:plastocyanin